MYTLIENANMKSSKKKDIEKNKKKLQKKQKKMK